VSGSVTLGNGVTYTGASNAAPVGPVSVVLATASGLPGADPNLLRQCTSSPAQLDPAKVANKIVVCERGGAAPNNARVDKSLAVKNAGGVGMILYNVVPNSLNADFHSVPTVHINNTDGAAVVAYVNGAGATATAKINQATFTFTAPDATSSDLVADDDQIGTDDDRHGRARWPEQRPKRHLRPRRGPY